MYFGERGVVYLRETQNEVQSFLTGSQNLLLEKKKDEVYNGDLYLTERGPRSIISYG